MNNNKVDYATSMWRCAKRRRYGWRYVWALGKLLLLGVPVALGWVALTGS